MATDPRIVEACELIARRWPTLCRDLDAATMERDVSALAFGRPAHARSLAMWWHEWITTTVQVAPARSTPEAYTPVVQIVTSAPRETTTPVKVTRVQRAPKASKDAALTDKLDEVRARYSITWSANVDPAVQGKIIAKLAAIDTAVAKREIKAGIATPVTTDKTIAA